MEISEKIKFLRKNILSISQAELASRLGVNSKTVKYWENGLTKPNTIHVKLLAYYCGVSTDYLINENHPLELYIRDISDEEYKIIESLIQYFEKKNEIEE